MIIQTGMRTDIPAFYSKWFLNRIREGYVLVRNPYNPSQVTKYSLSPEVVDLIAFCTKNPAPMLSHMDVLKSYGQYWFVTITPYGKDIEPNVPDKENSEFEKMAETLSGYTQSCVISFIDIYKKVERNFPYAREVSKQNRITLGKELIRIADRYGMTVRPCAEGNDLEPFGEDCSGCMTVNTFESALHSHLDVPKRKNNQRNGQCACLLGVDIGAYDTCGHLCKYCYANTNATLVKENMRKHDPASPFLVGGNMTGDVIHKAQQKSWIDRQMRLEI